MRHVVVGVERGKVVKGKVATDQNLGLVVAEVYRQCSEVFIFSEEDVMKMMELLIKGDSDVHN